jgi:Fe-S cluster biogenesis protein NfuA
MTGSSEPTTAGIRRRVEYGLIPVRQRLRSHGGELKVLTAQDGVVEVELLGACCGCPAANFTFTTVIAPAVRAVDGVTAVHTKQARYSRFIAARAGVAVLEDH